MDTSNDTKIGLQYMPIYEVGHVDREENMQKNKAIGHQGSGNREHKCIVLIVSARDPSSTSGKNATFF